MGMHCIVRCDELQKALAAQQGITGKKGNMAILSNLLLEAAEGRLTLTGTDLEIGLKQSIAAEVVDAGSITLPAKKLYELTRESGGNDIVLKEQDNAWMEIETGPSRYRLAGMTTDEFPQFPAHDQEALVDCPAGIFSELIDKTEFAIAQDKETVFSLTAALLQKVEQDGETCLKMVTSDGHRLTTMTRKADAQALAKLTIPPSTLIPRRGVQEIRKFCENRETVRFGVEEKQIVLQDEQSLLIIRLMKGDFPDFAALLKNMATDNMVHINRARFLEALKRMNLFTEDLSHAIKISLSAGKITLNSQHTEYGSATDGFEVDYKGPDIDLAFNCRFFIDAMQVMEGEVIDMAIQDEKSPCMITSAQDEGFVGIIMPMKL